MKHTKRSAFTIVELVIVIAVIAILSAVLIPTFGAIIKSANISADKAEASTLTTQLNLNLNGIKTQEDLYDVIEKVYGAEGAKTFAPRSAQYGYHFWFDLANNMVVLNTVAEIDELTKGRAIINSQWTESDEHFRYYKGYFFMDRGGSAVGELLTKIDEVGGGDVKFNDVLISLYNITGDDKAFAESAYTKLQSTAVVAYGTHVENASNEITYVYFSHTVEELFATDVTINNADKISMTLPSNITTLNTYCLDFANESDLYINATVDELKGMLAAYAVSTNCNIILPSGAYTVDGETIKDSDGNEVASSLDTTIASIVDDMDLSADASADKKIELVPNGEDYDLYVAVDYNGDITFSVLDFFNAAGEKIVARGEKWEVKSGNITYEDGKFKVTGFEDTTAAKAGEITAKIQGTTKTVHVYGVKVTNVTVSGYDNANLNIRYEGFDATNPTKFTKVITLPYIPNNTEGNKWNFVPSVETNYPDADVMPSGTVGVTNLDGMEYNTGILSIPAGYRGNAFTTANIEFKYDDESLEPVKSGVTYKFNLINNSDPSFELAEYVTKVKNKLTDYVVGNDGKIALKYLFQNVEGKDISNQIVVIEVYADSIDPVIRDTDINFNEYKLNLKDIEFSGLVPDKDGKYRIRISICLGEKESNENGEPTGKIINRGAVAELTVQFVAATNVTEDTKESDIPSGSNMDIVLLSDISLSSAKTFYNVFGNLHKINASTDSKGSSYWPEFIKLYGAMDNTLVIGPTYDAIKLNDHKQAWDGVALKAATSTITNSYLYGFRAPVSVHASGCTIKIENSTIEGGAYCNIHIASYKELILNNVDLVQDYAGYTVGSKKAYGLGVVFDDSGCKGTVTLAGNTNLYNWINESEGNKFTTSIYTLYKIKDLIKEMVKLGTDKGYIHDSYVNSGFIQVDGNNEVKCIEQDNDARGPKYTGSTYSKAGNITLGTFITKSFSAWSIPTCEGDCAHTSGTFLPEGWSHQNTNHSDAYLNNRPILTPAN